MRTFSTSQVAKLLGLWQPNLQRLIRQGKVKAPPLVKVGGLKIRLWSAADVERARKSLRKAKA
jgi:predicted DNA-binding transcriptional regulator AlpA